MRKVKFIYQFPAHYAFADADGQTEYFNDDGTPYNGPTYIHDIGEPIATHKAENFAFGQSFRHTPMLYRFLHLYTKPKKEGYWNDAKNNYPEYPMPEPNVLTENEAQEIFDLISQKEAVAQKLLARGLSHSRIDGSVLGCAEYHLGDWGWPGDFAPHYVLKHKCKPSNGFLQFIGYFDN